MLLHLLKSKLHQGAVTRSNLEYHGSLTVDVALMEQAGMRPYEWIHVFDISNGARFETYLIPGKRGSGCMEVNGAAARLVEVGDRVIVVTAAWMTEEEADAFRPKVLLLNEHNAVQRILEVGPCTPIEPDFDIP